METYNEELRTPPLALIALLSAGPDSKTTEHALGALLNITTLSPERKLRLLQAGAVDPLVALLRMALAASTPSAPSRMSAPRWRSC